MTARVLQLCAPYLAVAVFWVGLDSAWLAILAYHAQMLFWTRRRLGHDLGRWKTAAFAAVAVPAAITGPLIVVLLPHIARVPVAAWLEHYGLGGPALVLLIPYFGLVHPVLEQTFWAPLRRNSIVGHAAFAGYHAIVLYTLLPTPWLALAAGVLALASVAWERIAEAGDGLLVAMASHAVADVGVVVAALVLS
jgi:hypothetical protein